MKKNKMMRIASVLLMLCLLTTTVISGTFAKYVTSATRPDTARVAKFGVEVAFEGETFDKEYDTDNETIKASIAKSVKADSAVVAPGTTSTMAKITITGTPEVAVNVKYEPQLTLTGWEDADGAYYCPIEITIGTKTFKGNDYANAGAFADAVIAEIEGASANYEAGTALDGTAITASWSWAFEGNDDVKDTFLGNKETAPTIEINLVVTVTQIH